ncbi:indolepyruvate ferredoxin oxidoreductase family protein [Mycolicibacterium sediminis]|nr:indolepyruvate ferredoxin oxidoreductase family protein [Mycolicibacterium sediminis]
MAPAAPAHPDDRYRVDSGPVLLTGVQAIARLLVEQHDRDRRQGIRSATFVSGYQGSPLAGLDTLLAGVPWLRSEHDVRLVPGLNEELAATSVWGSQLELPSGSRTHDGVVGVWYGKGPGLDRAGDVMRHMSTYGTHPKGGVLAIVGDDPAAKSSTVPAASERSLAALNMPIVSPRNAEEIVAFGLHAVALSRASGCTVAMKLVADVADGLWTFDADVRGLSITVPRIDWQGTPWTYRQRLMGAPPDSLLAEADLYGPRWDMVRAFTDANDLDRIEVDTPDAWLGIVAVGPAYDAVRGALSDLGLDEAALHRAGIRILRVGMPFPLGENRVRDLARGVETVLVVEDKTAFVESQVRDALYGTASTPDVLGKRDHDGRPLIPADGELTAARLLAPLRRTLRGRVELASPARGPIPLEVLPTTRTPYFCSGCPHNRSTAVPAGSLAGGGIGCHTLVTMSGRTDSQVTGLTQMGGEGAQWIGQAPFTDVSHVFQNVGDGTYFHSGQLALQACIAAGVNITYKLLFNGAVAMTGAQDAQGGLSVPALTHKLAAEGVARIIVCADEPERHTGARLAAGTAVWHRDRLDEAQRLLRDVPGVTVLIYDQHCAADARRKRKRGELPVRRTRVVINEAVCEGCGDCGVKSNCLSVQPVDTEFGRKTRIDQTGCNTDYSCLDGECPSFVTVEIPEDPVASTTKTPSPPAVAEPELPTVGGSFNVFLAGIGGTGIVTVNQVLGTAALRAGLHVQGLDQTGLSQKAGPVTSHLRISRTQTPTSNRIGAVAADCVLAFDLLTAADAKNAAVAGADRTTTIASTSRTPTGEMVYDPSVTHPDAGRLLDRLAASSRNVVTMDALAAAQTLFGNTMVANFLLVGAAYQAGALPIPRQHVLDAIAFNGAAVTANQAAFEWGRVAVAHPTAFAAAVTPPVARPAMLDPDHPLLRASTLTGETADLVRRRAAELIAYQGPRIAAEYVATVESAWAAERLVGEDTAYGEAVARGLFKLTAYKDEYEVARLLTDPAFLDTVRAEVPGGTDLTYRLHPPTLKALGRDRKVGFGPKSHVALRLLKHGRRLRGTALDPFGHTRMRRLERTLLAHYRSLIEETTGGLSAATYDRAVAIAEAADLVRGYEDVKLRSVDRYRARLLELGVDTGRI